MIKLRYVLDGVEMCEHLLRGENRIVDNSMADESSIVYSGAIDHLYMLYNDARDIFFVIDDPGTYNGTYGAKIGSAYYDTIFTAADGETIYGVSKSGGREELDAETLSTADYFYVVYHGTISERSIVATCGIKETT